MIDDSGGNEIRRLRLRVLIKVMLSVAAGTVLFVLLAFFFSGEDERPRVPGLRVDVSNLQPGETERLLWEGRPVLVQRRTPAMIDALQSPAATLDGRLRDPDSRRSDQPESMVNAVRSRDPEWFVAIALGTDQGCPVSVASGDEMAQTDTGSEANSGGVELVDECRGSRYDGAGRVLADQYADRNLAVPDYVLETLDGRLTLVLGR